MDAVLIAIIAIAVIAVIALLIAVSRRSKAVRDEHRSDLEEARGVAREQHQRAELSEAEKHHARADVAQERAEREKLAAELHETRAGNGRPARAVDRDTGDPGSDVVDGEVARTR